MESQQIPTWQIYDAHAAHASLERGRESGTLAVTDRGFRFRGDKGEFFIPLAGAQLTLGGASDRLIFIAHPTEPGLSIYTADRSIFKNPILIAHPDLTATLRGMRNKHRRNWSILIAACALVVAVPIAFAVNIDFFAGLVAKQVPHEWEEQLGKTALGQIQVQSDFMAGDDVDPLLKEITAPLVRALETQKSDTPPYTFHFYIANDKTINAFALPGGYVVIHSELLLRAESADELLGVLAHEISHVTERHGTRSIIANTGAWLVFQAVIGDAGGLFGTIASAAPFLLTQKYSRSFESDADEQGYRLLEKAHINAQGMVTFFGRIRDEEASMRKKAEQQMGGKSADVLTDLPEFLRTHPLTEKRIAHIEKLASAQHGPYQDLNPQFAELRAKVREFAARDKPMPDKPTADKPVANKKDTSTVPTSSPEATP